MLESISLGEAPLSGVIAAKILKEFSQPQLESPEAMEIVEDLTTREIDILELVVEGMTNKEIASALNISENTVKIHLRNIWKNYIFKIASRQLCTPFERDW